jgi:hypothetical protein
MARPRQPKRAETYRHEDEALLLSGVVGPQAAIRTSGVRWRG